MPSFSLSAQLQRTIAKSKIPQSKTQRNSTALSWTAITHEHHEKLGKLVPPLGAEPISALKTLRVMAKKTLPAKPSSNHFSFCLCSLQHLELSEDK